MSFEERFAKWKQDGQEFRQALRDMILAVERKKNPGLTLEELEAHAKVLMHEMLDTSQVTVEVTASLKPTEEGYSWPVDVSIKSEPATRLMDEYHDREFAPTEIAIAPHKPFSLCRPDNVRDVNVSTGDEVEIKPVPSAPYERAVVASDLWRMIVDEGETGRTNAWIEQYFERLQEKYYGKVFLRVKIDGLQVGVQHLIAPDTWVKL